MLALSIIAIVLASLAFVGVVCTWIYLIWVRKRFLVQVRKRMSQPEQRHPFQEVEGEGRLRVVGDPEASREAR